MTDINYYEVDDETVISWFINSKDELEYTKYVAEDGGVLTILPNDDIEDTLDSLWV